MHAENSESKEIEFISCNLPSIFRNIKVPIINEDKHEKMARVKIWHFKKIQQKEFLKIQ